MRFSAFSNRTQSRPFLFDTFPVCFYGLERKGKTKGKIEGKKLTVLVSQKKSLYHW